MKTYGWSRARRQSVPVSVIFGSDRQIFSDKVKMGIITDNQPVNRSASFDSKYFSEKLNK